MFNAGEHGGRWLDLIALQFRYTAAYKLTVTAFG
jgi:hypothetical protein